MKIILANPRGFCAGVDRAIQIVERSLERFGVPIYVRHEIVHNKTVVNRLKTMGAIFVEEVDEVPEGGVVIFSAHGVAESVYASAKKRNQVVIDASCPLVKKVHSSAKRHYSRGAHVILIGHAGHAEVEGTLGQIEPGNMSLVATVEDVQNLQLPEHTELAYITQTTLSVNETKDVIIALKNKYPHISGPEKGDLCYATTNRQAAVQQLTQEVDLLLIIGASYSSNSNRLREMGEAAGLPSYLIGEATDMRREWFENVQTVGISSGASAPEEVVQHVVEWITQNFAVESVANSVFLEENVRFSLPSELL